MPLNVIMFKHFSKETMSVSTVKYQAWAGPNVTLRDESSRSGRLQGRARKAGIKFLLTGFTESFAAICCGEWLKLTKHCSFHIHSPYHSLTWAWVDQFSEGSSIFLLLLSSVTYVSYSSFTLLMFPWKLATSIGNVVSIPIFYIHERLGLIIRNFAIQRR